MLSVPCIRAPAPLNCPHKPCPWPRALDQNSGQQVFSHWAWELGQRTRPEDLGAKVEGSMSMMSQFKWNWDLKTQQAERNEVEAQRAAALTRGWEG